MFMTIIRTPIYAFALGIICTLLVPISTHATDPTFELSAWVPYWKVGTGTADTLAHLSTLTEVNPFIYTVRADGSLNQASSLSSTEWQTLRKEAKKQNVRFVPTIMWGNGEAIDAILRNPESRRAHIAAITKEVFTYDLDGIDIDYEAKLAETNLYFTLFLKELKEAIGFNKWVMCTIEPRMPLESRYANPEEKLKLLAYANDFDAINAHCDRVRIMAYDQGRADLQFNEHNADPYIPVADVRWVESVVKLAMEDINPNKITIGVATYGYEYDMFPTTKGATTMQYSRLWSFSYNYAAGKTGIATKLKLPIQRTAGGEAMLTFPASASPEPEKPLPNATRVMIWSDAKALEGKIKLAQKLGVRGVSIFRIDGAQDPDTWSILEKYPKGTKGDGAQKKPDVNIAQGTVTGTTPTGSTSVSVSMPTRDLELGMRHADVKKLQEFLNNNGFIIVATGGGSKGNETTYFGPATKDALIRFQKLHNLTPATGYYGPKTRALIAGLDH